MIYNVIQYNTMHYKILDAYRNFFCEIFFKFKVKTLNICRVLFI